MVFRSNELDLLILQNGKDGTPSDSKYTWVKYSKNANGIPMTDNSTDAVYMGIAYNKESEIESDNPNDYTWIKVLGNNGQDAYTVYLTNENITFAIEYDNNNPVSNQSFTSEIKVFHGVDERTDFIVGEVISSDGITVGIENNVITISVNMGTALTKESGYIRVPINIDGLVFFKDIAWNTSRQGTPGLQGIGALNIVVENESQMIPCTNEGTVLDDILLTIPFSAYKGFDRISCSAIVGPLPSGMTLGSNTASTENEKGSVVLNIAKNSTLGNAALTSGTVEITFSIEDKTLTRNFIWTKVKDGSSGTIYSLELSTVVLSRGFNNTLSPSVITLNAYQIKDGVRSPYDGRFIISQQTFNSYNLLDENGYLLMDENGFLLFESVDGTNNYENVYVSSENEHEYVYDLSSQFISGMIIYLCEADNISNILDQQSVVVLTNIDEIRPTIDEIKTTMSGVSSTVDNINKQIINKVWQSDITESINNYDNTTIKEIRDKQTQQTIDIDGIKQSVTDVTSTFEEDIQTLNEKTTQLEQDAEGFKTTVSETYATKDELGNTSETLQSAIEQTANEITQQVTDLEGNVSTNTQNISSITQRIETAEGSITQIEQNQEEVLIEVSKKKDVFPAKVRYIRDWLGENNIDGEKGWVDISVMIANDDPTMDDVNIATGIIPTSDIAIQGASYYTDGNINTYVSSDTPGMHYLQIDLGSNSFADGYIIVTHAFFRKYFLTNESGNVLINQDGDILYTTENVNNRMYEHKLEVSEDGNNWYTLYDSNNSGTYVETENGRTYFINDGYIKNNVVQFRVDINGISSTVSSVQDQASNNEQRIISSESTIEQLSDSISNLVTDADGQSLMTQTSTGWTFNISSVQDQIDKATSNISDLQINLGQTSDMLDQTNSLLNDVTQKTAYINMATDDSGAPCIELGKQGNPFKLRITNTSIDFMQDNIRIAYITNRQLYIEKSVVTDEMKVGSTSGFIWKKRSNGNMGLRWVGE